MKGFIGMVKYLGSAPGLGFTLRKKKFCRFLIRLFFLLGFSSVVFSQKETQLNTIMSQTLNGSISISGDVLFHYNDYWMTIYISGNAGYFVTNNLLIGVCATDCLTTDNNYTSADFAFGPLLEYYFGNSPSKPFLGITIQKTSSSNSYRKFMYQFKVGYSIAIAKYLALQPILQVFGYEKKFGNLLLYGLGIKSFIF